jgi:antitoxin VapB
MRRRESQSPWWGRCDHDAIQFVMTKPIQIKKDDVARDIRELAALTGEGITEAVGEAVRDRLERVRRRSSVEQRRQEVARIVASYAKLPRIGPPLTDDDLYDDYGLPK